MEANVCDVNHLGADVLLPPRKRLLAGFKRQTTDGGAALHPPVVVSSSSLASTSSLSLPSLSPLCPSPHPPSPTPCSPASIEFQNHLDNLLGSHFSNYHNLSPEQIVEASKISANAATKAAEAARAAAHEKAITAAKAVTAAKSALALVASFPEEMAAKEKYLKKNKLKKHIQVQVLYEKHQPIENYRDDEEFARKLHQVMNSSPRISKNSSSSDFKGQKIKKPKTSSPSERIRVSNGSIVFGANPSSVCNGLALTGELDSEDSIREVYTSGADEKDSKYENSNQQDMDNGEAESSHLKEKILGGSGSPSKKRGRLKTKKLPLSDCNNRDQANPMEDNFPRSYPMTDKDMENSTTRNKPLFLAEPSADNLMPMRKCQEFRAPACSKQNKVMHS